MSQEKVPASAAAAATERQSAGETSDEIMADDAQADGEQKAAAQASADDKDEEVEDEEEDKPMCRYCFDEGDADNPLISPCKCKGGQKWVHLSCLRRWQRMTMVSQPTHPACEFWRV